MTLNQIVVLRRRVRFHYRTWCLRRPGLGPCYPIAQALVELGLAQAAIHGFYRTHRGKRWWNHWVAIDQHEIVDISGAWIEDPNAQPTYRFDIDPVHESWDQSDIEWWKRKLCL